LIQLRESFRIADIGPFSAELKRFYFLSRLRQIANSVLTGLRCEGQASEAVVYFHVTSGGARDLLVTATGTFT